MHSAISKEQEAELRVLHADVVMIRAGAALSVEGKRRSWWGICQWCRNPRWLQVAHVEPVGKARHLRFDPENAVALCGGCHLFKWHKWPRKAEAFITRLMGEKARAALALRADARGFVPQYTLTKLHLLAVRARMTLRTGRNPVLEGESNARP